MIKFFNEYLRMVLALTGIGLLLAGVGVSNPVLTTTLCLSAIFFSAIETVSLKKKIKKGE